MLEVHEKALNDIVGDVTDMKNIIKSIIQRVEKLELEVHMNKAEYKAERI